MRDDKHILSRYNIDVLAHYFKIEQATTTWNTLWSIHHYNPHSVESIFRLALSVTSRKLREMIRMTKRFHAGMVIRSPRSSPELALDHDFVFLMCCEVVFADGDDGEYKISDVDTGFNKFTSLTLQTCMFKTKDHEERFINTLKREFQALNPDQYTEALVWYDEVLRSPGIALLK